MTRTKTRGKGSYLILVGVIVLILSVGPVALRSFGTPLNWIIRVAALSGYMAIFLVIVSSAYMREMLRFFGRSFIKVHHILSVSGLFLITVHPLMVAIDSLTLGVFAPRFDSWRIFMQLGGRPAWYLLVIASLIALLRKQIGRKWRTIHMLNYVAFWLGSVHAILIGTSFQSTVMKAVPVIMSLIIIAIFIQKRLQARRRRRR